MIEFIVASVCAVVSASAAFVVKRRGILDHPTDRGLHSVPTPRGGGIGIVIVSLPAWIVTAALQGLSWRRTIAWPAGAAMVAIVGILDDMHSLPRAPRFAAHIAAAAVAVGGYGPWRVVDLFGLGAINLGIFAIPLTLLWIVALTNIYNFMDGSNGIAGLQALIAGAGWWILGSMNGQTSIGVLSAAIAGGSLGFLILNWSPASVFMGDVGATFLGYTFAVLPLLVGDRYPAEATAGALFVWPFLFDGTLTIVRRALAGENVLVPHRSHLYQRLIRCALSHAMVALLYGLLALLSVVVAVVFLPGATVLLYVIAAAAILLFAGTLLAERSSRRAPPLHEGRGV